MNTTRRSWMLALVLALPLGAAWAADISGKVVGVLDGDTIDLLKGDRQTVRVRLAGIDAPEKRQAFGAEAKKALSDLVYGRDLVVSTDKADRYGRAIGKLMLRGTDVNLEMVKRGFAWHYGRFESDQTATDRAAYRAAEVQARQRHLGLWRDADPMAPWDFRKHGHHAKGDATE